MQAAPEPQLETLPTKSGLPLRLADFDTFVDAVDYASKGATGLNYYSARGEILEHLSYVDMRARSEKLAGRLLALGLERGDRVAILAETNSDFAVAFIGALYAGLIPAPLPLPVAFGQRDAYSDQLRRIITTAGARAVFTPAEYEEWVKEAMAPLGLSYVGQVKDLPDADRVTERVKVASTDLAYHG